MMKVVTKMRRMMLATLRIDTRNGKRTSASIAAPSKQEGEVETSLPPRRNADLRMKEKSLRLLNIKSILTITSKTTIG
jgi:hypothetical protein